MNITLSLPWLATLPLSALLDTLPDGWAVDALDGRPMVERRRARGMSLDWDWIPAPGFADYGRRLAELVQAIAATVPDPLAYLAALYAMREQAETAESIALAERARAAWAEVQR